MAKVPFEKSKYDVEKPGEKEGSKADIARDARQKKAAQSRGVQFMKRGGRARGRK